MNREQRKRIYNLIAHLLMLLFVMGLQTSFWPKVASPLHSPPFWIFGLLHFSVYRSAIELVIISYSLTLFAFCFSLVPTGLFLSTVLILGFATRSFRNRVFWTGRSYFGLICGPAILLFYIIYFFLSRMFEPTPIQNPEILEWLVHSFIGILVSPFFYFILGVIDHIGFVESHRMSDS